MLFLVVGINWSKADTKIREKLVFTKEEIVKGNRELNQKNGVLQNAILSTCNRTEIYAVVEKMEDAEQVIEFLAEFKKVPVQQMVHYLDIYTKNDAIEYLFKVATGIKSKVVGETQILGQVKESFQLALESNTTKKHLNELFKRVIAFAKHSHTKHNINDNPVSIGYMAVKTIEDMFHRGLKGKKVAVIGAGETAGLTIQHLRQAKAEKIYVLNRTMENALCLTKKFDVGTVPMTFLMQVLADVDVVIAATSSPDYVITEEMLKEVSQQRNNKKLLMMDISVPMNIEMPKKEDHNIKILNIDNLNTILDENSSKRKRKAMLIELEVEKEVEEFEKWIRELKAIPIIKELQTYTSNLKTEAIIKINEELAALTKKERSIVNKQINYTINQALTYSIELAKECAYKGKDINWDILENFLPKKDKQMESLGLVIMKNNKY